MKSARALFFALAMATSLTAAAQYQWIDKNGSRVYSDVAPPADIPAKNILKQPRGSSLSTPVTEAPAQAAAASAATPASGPATAGVDKALEEKKKQAEAAEAAKKKAESKSWPRPALRTASAHAKARPPWIRACAWRAPTRRASARCWTIPSAPPS